MTNQQEQQHTDADVVVDLLRTMRLQEESDGYRCIDYLTAAHADAEPIVIDAECRTKMFAWSTQIVDFCNFRRETVSIAMGYLDRFMMSSITPVHNPAARRAMSSRRDYQLAAMTALYLAVKLHEPLELETALVSELSRGLYTAREIARTERDMLEALGWRMSGPTPLGFYGHFVALLRSSKTQTQAKRSTEDDDDDVAEEVLFELGRRQTELAAADYDLATSTNASTVAAAALANALEATGDSIMPSAEKVAFLRDVSEASGIDTQGVEVQIARRSLARGTTLVGEEMDDDERRGKQEREEEEDPEPRHEEEDRLDSEHEPAGQQSKKRCSCCSCSSSRRRRWPAATGSPTCVSKR